MNNNKQCISLHVGYLFPMAAHRRRPSNTAKENDTCPNDVIITSTSTSTITMSERCIRKTIHSKMFTFYVRYLYYVHILVYLLRNHCIHLLLLYYIMLQCSIAYHTIYIYIYVIAVEGLSERRRLVIGQATACYAREGCVYVYVYIYIYTYIHTYIHTFIHTLLHIVYYI